MPPLRSSTRTVCAGLRPSFRELAKLRLRPGCGRAPPARGPGPTDQAVLGQVPDKRREIAVAVAAAIFDLGADLRWRAALPCHRRRRQMPIRMARGASGIEVGCMMAR